MLIQAGKQTNRRRVDKIIR